MRSRFYVGRVGHERLLPRRHAFEYPLWLCLLDLDELPALDREVRGFGYNRFAAVSVRDADYLERGPGSIREKLLRRLAEHGCADGVARIELLTAARCFGAVFNPVSFYYCYRSDGALRCAVAEVSNTFGERHLYVLPRPVEGRAGWPALFRAAKVFHVSPFNDLRGHYEIELGEPGDTLRVAVRLHRPEGRVLDAWVDARALPLTSTNLRRALLRRPLSAVLTLPRIAWEAARLLWQRRLPVYERPAPADPLTLRRRAPSAVQRLLKPRVLAVFARVRRGRLDVETPEGEALAFGGAAPGPAARLRIRDPRFFSRVAQDGDIGFGEAFVAGDWDSDDPTAVLRLLARNREAVEAAAAAPAARALNLWRHARNRNTLAGSRSNIRAHYDLGNEFYRQFLDPETMLYSCAVFDRPGMTLEEAQRSRLARLLELAAPRDGHDVLEIGSGWGGFAIAAARAVACRVTGLTLSTEQLRLAGERAAAAGVGDRVAFELCDYRRARGAYDRIVSIEMLEAVGHENLGAYFAACDRLLKPGGRVLLQVITIPDQRYECYRRNPDWIQKHIFPGGHLPSLGVLCRAMAACSTLGVERVENIGPHYAPTLRAWRERFEARRDELERLGYDPRFQRKWRYYLHYCEAAFAERLLNDLLIVLARPGEEPA